MLATVLQLLKVLVITAVELTMGELSSVYEIRIYRVIRGYHIYKEVWDPPLSQSAKLLDNLLALTCTYTPGDIPSK